MKNKSAKIALFIGTLIVGILIAINFNFDGIASKQLTRNIKMLLKREHSYISK